jgi:hypothetical protein
MISFYHINQTNHAKITVQTFNLKLLLNLLGFQNLTGLGRVRLIAPLHRNPLWLRYVIALRATTRNPRSFHRHCGESRNPLTQRVILNSILTVEDIGFQSKTSKQSFENQSSDTNLLFLCYQKVFF